MTLTAAVELLIQLTPMPDVGKVCGKCRRCSFVVAGEPRDVHTWAMNHITQIHPAALRMPMAPWWEPPNEDGKIAHAVHCPECGGKPTTIYGEHETDTWLATHRRTTGHTPRVRGIHATDRYGYHL